MDKQAIKYTGRELRISHSVTIAAQSYNKCDVWKRIVPARSRVPSRVECRQWRFEWRAGVQLGHVPVSSPLSALLNPACSNALFSTSDI